MSDNTEYERIHFVTISDEVFRSMPNELILSFNSVRTDRLDDEIFKDDENYTKLKKTYLKAKKEFEDYKYNKRHNHK